MLALGNEGTRSESHYKRVTRFINSWHKDEKLYDTQVARTGRSPVIFIARHTPPPPGAYCRRYFFTQNPGFQITCTFSVHRAGNQILYIFGQGFHPKSINTTSCSMRSKIKYTLFLVLIFLNRICEFQVLQERKLKLLQLVYFS